MLITKDWADDDGGGTFLLDEGKYSFEVAKAEDKKSKAGNEMIELTLHVYDGKGGAKVFVYDWLVDVYKKRVVDFCRCVGLSDLVDGGELKAVRCVQRTGEVHLIQEEYEGKKRNKVDRYDYTTPQKVPAGDDIPF
jgi:hypothetical protein